MISSEKASPGKHLDEDVLCQRSVADPSITVGQKVNSRGWSSNKLMCIQWYSMSSVNDEENFRDVSVNIKEHTKIGSPKN